MEGLKSLWESFNATVWHGSTTLNPKALFLTVAVSETLPPELSYRHVTHLR
jgi:hypothetical protein